MEEEKHEVEHRFYQRCAELLGVPDTYRPYPYKKRTRWNNRTAGNGRFAGCGLIRLFGTHVHVALIAPVTANKMFTSHAAALEWLEGVVAK